jgi:hypothetical protein
MRSKLVTYLKPMRTLQKAQIKGSETPRELIMESQLERGQASV